jgi:Cu+-exporting ATPase
MGPGAVMPDEAPEARCPRCGRPVDPLRAGQVAILEGRFEYFCGSECKQTYLREGGAMALEELATAEPPPVASVAAPRTLVGVASNAALPAPAVTGALAAARPGEPPPIRDEELPLAPPERALAVIDFAGVLFGVLVVAFGLLDGLDIARVVLASAAWLALAARTWRVERDPADLSPIVAVVPAALAASLAIGAQAVSDPHAMAIANLAGLACATAIVVERLVAGARDRVAADRARIIRLLDVPVCVLRGREPMQVAPSEVRPGEPFMVLAGEVVGADAVVSSGQARVIPWLDAGIEIDRREGDPIVAGAKLVSNRLRMTTTWSGRERAWVKLLATARWRVDVAAPTVRALRRGVEWGAPLAGVLPAAAALAANASLVQVVASLIAGVIAATSKAAPCFAALLYARAHLRALGQGITYRDAQSFERAAATDIAVFCARGTVLLGEPEIVAVEPIGTPSRSPSPTPDGPASGDAEDAYVLALAAGAETGSTHPFGIAILRAARARGVAPDHVRNANTLSGLGVTAIASTGERLVVGGRAIMLSEKIGGAVAEERVSKLQSQGRSVLLVALGDRLVGLIALQDGLRPGARTAVQKLLDAGIEPVLLSGESRETCESIGRALDIDHVRPEVLPRDRRSEVLALGEGGSVVSVVGHPTHDDQALGAANVAVAMNAAGATPGEWAVALASDDVSHAADALVIPRAASAQAKIASALALAPAIFALLAIAFGVAPLALGPVATLIGALVAVLYLRSSRGLYAA